MEMADGVYTVWQEAPGSSDRLNEKKFDSFKSFFEDLRYILELMSHGSTKTFCFKRLRILQTRFHLHRMLNDGLERWETRNCLHRDFYNVRKVDNHVHHSSCMNQKHLLRFMKSRIKMCPNAVVQEKDGELVTLSELVRELGIKPHELSNDTLDMRILHELQASYHLDKLNMNGMRQLWILFLKTNNYMKGRFLSEITRQVFNELVQSKWRSGEFQLSISGADINEWDELACWICKNDMQANHIKWIIQIPRLYTTYKKANLVKNFEEMLDNIFRPLFEVTIDPSSHPELHLFLQLIVGFGTADEESKRERIRKHFPKPVDWDTTENPPYTVYSYYLYSNLYVLNLLREARGMNTFLWRPYAGESGDLDHLAVSFMIADSIQHGITLKRTPVLQYLYYLAQIGIAMSPLSNNLLHVEYHKNPFPVFFTRGLHVTLSTDDPLMIHLTKEPLIEEYSIAAQLWKLSNIDMCEIARNSVLISGFSHATKCHWIGHGYKKRGPQGNCIIKTNVPNVRLLFRKEMLKEEEDFLTNLSPVSSWKPLLRARPPRINLSKRVLAGRRTVDMMDNKLRDISVAILPTKEERMSTCVDVRSRWGWFREKTYLACVFIGIITGMFITKARADREFCKEKCPK